MHNLIKNLKSEFHAYRNLVFVVFVFCMSLVMSFFAMSDMHQSSAANLSNFKPGNIISDAVMSNYTAMSVSDIQSFLDSKNKCDNRDYNLYLQYTAAHPTITWHWEGEPYNGHFVCLAQEKFGDGEIIGSGMTAAEIIYDAAQENKINPQVLLVLLQKETSLITDKVPNSSDYRKATGYGCPDTAACDSKYYGFKNQVYRAAELFRYTLDHGYSLYPVGVNVYVGYNPSSSCGGSTIKIENNATAALYRYTPYQPNNAALNAGYGTGDVCSAYGNRNFYLYFTDWFGSTQAAVNGELAVVPNGEYNIVSAINAERTLGLSGTNAVLANLSERDKTQRWQLERNSTTGYYSITNVSTGKPLIPQSTEVDQNTNVLAGNSTTCSKWWKLYRTSDGYLTFETTCTAGMVLDVKNGSSAAGTNIEMFITDSTNAQKWTLRAGQTLEDGLYVIESASNPDIAIDIYGGYTDNDTNVQVWLNRTARWQRWNIKYDAAGGYYTIVNPNSQKNLDLNKAIAQTGQNIQIWQNSGSCAQHWQIIPNGSSYNIMSTCAPGYVVDIKDGNVAITQNVQLGSFSNSNAQRWNFTEVEPAVEEGIYIIKPAASQNKAVDIYGGYKTGGTNIELYDAHGSDWQQWQIIYNSVTDDYSLYNPYSDKYLDLYGAFTRAGENIQIWNGNGGCNQRWQIEKNAQGYYTLLSACNNNMALDLYGGYTQNRTNIQIWPSHGGLSQQWDLVSVDR